MNKASPNVPLYVHVPHEAAKSNVAAGLLPFCCKKGVLRIPTSCCTEIKIALLCVRILLQKESRACHEAKFGLEVWIGSSLAHTTEVFVMYL